MTSGENQNKGHSYIRIRWGLVNIHNREADACGVAADISAFVTVASSRR